MTVANPQMESAARPGRDGHPAVGHVLARPSTALAPRVVILGGGFAGVTTAVGLAKRCAGVLPVHITLVSAQNFFLFTPMLAEREPVPEMTLSALESPSMSHGLSVSRLRLASLRVTTRSSTPISIPDRR